MLSVNLALTFLLFGKHGAPANTGIGKIPLS